MVSSIKASCLDSATCLFNGIECCDKKLHYVTLKCITLDFIIQKLNENSNRFSKCGVKAPNFPIGFEQQSLDGN